MTDQQDIQKPECKPEDYKIQEQESPAAVGSGPSVTFAIASIDVSREMIISAVKEAGYVMLMPLRSKAVALELEIMNQGKDPFIAFFQLADLLDETYRAWARDPLGGDRRG